MGRALPVGRLEDALEPATLAAAAAAAPVRWHRPCGDSSSKAEEG